MMNKNDIRHISAPRRGGFMDIPESLSRLTVRKVSLSKLVQQDITYKEMAKISGYSEYEIRRYLGLIQ
jgi:response regulator of citrate/malate metabolism